LQAIRISIFLTFSHYGVLHIIGLNREQAPIDFLVKYLFYLNLAGGIIFYKSNVAAQGYAILSVFILLWLLSVIASRPLNRGYFKNK
jgi:hypothetical protein